MGIMYTFLRFCDQNTELAARHIWRKKLIACSDGIFLEGGVLWHYVTASCFHAFSKTGSSKYEMKLNLRRKT